MSMSVKNVDQIKATVRQFLQRSFHGKTLTDEQNIFDLGLVHSLFLIQMILFLEKEFGVVLEPQQLDTSALSSIERIASLVCEHAVSEAV